MNNNIELIELLNNTPVDKWAVEIGEETMALLKRKGIDGEWRNKLISETSEILSLCGNPKKVTHQNIGLVFGYVQSGKTLSFTALTTLAKDNGYQIIIVLAGTATNLVNQSASRLEQDLQLNQYGRPWVSYKNPTTQKYRDEIDKLLKNWRNPKFPKDDKKTLLITVMKQKDHLNNLAFLLQSIDLEGVPTLIVDDEADQASLNGKASKNAKNQQKGNSLLANEETTIYTLIKDLKQQIPHYTFVQYTATPQANLFIDIYDDLSPNFAVLLSAGEKYTGGKVFFEEERTSLIRNIPEQEILNKDESPFATAPASLLEALRLFFLGVASGKLRGEHKSTRRSMIVHPSKEVERHGVYERWVRNAVTHWIKLLEAPKNDFARRTLLQNFETTYQDLQKTVSDLEDFTVLSNGLEHILSETLPFIKPVNSDKKSGNDTHVEWMKNYAHILVGGQALNRGYTVEGLTVTYMPRNLGKLLKNNTEQYKSKGFADTMQQRARFFGYKRDYLGFCRVFLDQDTMYAYENYVLHEEDMRQRIEASNKAGKLLNDLYREVKLDIGLDLTNPNRLSHKLEREDLKGWLTIRKPHFSKEDVGHNQKVIEKFRDITQFVISPKNKSHYYGEVRIQELKTRLLDRLLFSNPKDNGNYSSLKSWFEQYALTSGNELCDIYIMLNKDKLGVETPRERKLNDNGEVQQYFTGNANSENNERNYREENKICIQVHILDLVSYTNRKQKDTEKIMIASNVPSLAMWIPEHIGGYLIRWKDE